jgi:alpha-tubulin suppressor-like RCC1 family protein
MSVIRHSLFANKAGIVDVACGQSHTLALKSNGTLYATGDNGNGQLGLGDTTNRTSFTLVSNLSDVIAVACGSRSRSPLSLKSDGTLYATGYNAYGQLGLGDTTDRSTFTLVPFPE